MSRSAVLVAVLALAPSGLASAQSTDAIQVWIDVDPSAAGGYGLVINDDGLALAQAFHSPELVVRGVSATFGNAGIDETLTDCERRRRALRTARSWSVYRGAASGDELGPRDRRPRGPWPRRFAPSRSPSWRSARSRRWPRSWRNHPDLVERVVAVVVVAGRRPSQRFVAETTRSEPLMDLNFELDAHGVSGPARCRPADRPGAVRDRIEGRPDTGRHGPASPSGGPAARWLAGPAAGLAGVVGARGSASTAFIRSTRWPWRISRRPHWLTCDRMCRRRSKQRPMTCRCRPWASAAPDKPYLVVSAEIASARRVRYCFDVDAGVQARSARANEVDALAMK